MPLTSSAASLLFSALIAMLAAPASLAAEADSPPPKQVTRSTIEALEIEGVWYCRWTVINMTGRAITVPSQPRIVNIRPKRMDVASAHDMIFRNARNIELRPKEGFVKMLPLRGVKLLSGDYTIGARMGEGYRDLEPDRCAFSVPDE